MNTKRAHEGRHVSHSDLGLRVSHLLVIYPREKSRARLLGDAGTRKEKVSYSMKTFSRLLNFFTDRSTTDRPLSLTAPHAPAGKH